MTKSFNFPHLIYCPFQKAGICRLIPWSTLTAFHGGDDTGCKLKESGTLHWASPNYGADNSSGFAALSGGYLNLKYSIYVVKGPVAYWWSSTEYSTYKANGICKRFDYYNIGNLAYNKSDGYSVGCIKD